MQASLKMTASPALALISVTNSRYCSHFLIPAGQARFALWLPGTTQTPPSPGPSSASRYSMTQSPVKILPSR